MPIFKGQLPEDWSTSMYYHYYEFGPPHWAMPCYGVCTEGYKLIYYYTINQWELFDLQKDADEIENLFLKGGMEINPRYEAVFKELLDELTRLRKYYKDDSGTSVRVWDRKDYN